jgi:apolipoprotein N-acyltransferase
MNTEKAMAEAAGIAMLTLSIVLMATSAAHALGDFDEFLQFALGVLSALCFVGGYKRLRDSDTRAKPGDKGTLGSTSGE